MSDRLGDTPSTEVYSAHVALSRYIVFSTLHISCVQHFLQHRTNLATSGGCSSLRTALHCSVCTSLGFGFHGKLCGLRCTRVLQSVVARPPLWGWQMGSWITRHHQHRHRPELASSYLSGIFIVELYIFMDIVLKVCLCL